VGCEIAGALGAELDVLLVRKLGRPGREKLAMGAIATGGVLVVNEDVIRGVDAAPEFVQAWNLRDRHMADTLDALTEHQRPPTPATHTSVIARALPTAPPAPTANTSSRPHPRNKDLAALVELAASTMVFSTPKRAPHTLASRTPFRS
jgi:hypothetical protein